MSGWILVAVITIAGWWALAKFWNWWDRY